MSWTEVPLRRIFRIINGGTPISDDQFWNGNVPWATPVDIGYVDGKYLEFTQRHLTLEGVAAGSREVPAESLLLSTRAPIGYVAQTKRSMAFNQGCRGLIATKEIDARYFRYQLLKLRHELISRGAGSTFMELSGDSLAAIPLTCPPLEKQRRIADFLDAETARIDGLTAARNKQLVALRELALSKISSIVPSEANVSFVRLGYLSTIQSGITVDGGRESGKDAVTLPYLRVANVQNGHLALNSITEITIPRQVARSATLRQGDVLMTEGGDLDKLGRGTVWHGEIKDCLHQNHVFAVRPDQRRLVPDYLALMTRTAYARSYFEITGTKTTNLASTSSSKIRDFRVPIISIEEQVRIYRETDAWLSGIAKVEAVLQRQLDLLAERRQALITAAVTGRITV